MTIDAHTLQDAIERLRAAGPQADRDETREVFATLRRALSAGVVRSAEPDAGSPGGWRVNRWVKEGILLGFRSGDLVDASADHGRWPFFDKDTLPLKPLTLEHGVRVVPGGSSVRDGAYLAPGVICMPPMYINIGAYVGEGTMVDSHALIGSCAQIGARVHVSAAAQVGGVIEPVGAVPVVIEDDVLIGGNTGIYEGAIVKARAVIAAVALASPQVHAMLVAGADQTFCMLTPQHIYSIEAWYADLTEPTAHEIRELLVAAVQNLLLSRHSNFLIERVDS